MVVFQALTWEARDEDEAHIVSIFGRTSEGESVCVTTNFLPFFYVKLNPGEGKMGAELLYKKINKLCPGCLSRFALSQAKDVWGFQNNKKSLFIKLYFNSLMAFKMVNNTLRRTLPEEFRPRRVYESNLDPVLRLMHLTGIQSTGWLDSGDNCIQGNYAHTDIDLYCRDWKTLKPVEKNEIAPFVFASIDIECNSSTGKFPDPEIEGDACFQIAISLIHFGDDEPYYKTCLCYKKTDTDVKGASIVSFPSEKELLVGFRHFLHQHDVDILTGWNIFGFDMNYIYERAVLCGCPNIFYNLGKLKDTKSKIMYKNLSSSALGHNEFKLLPMPGRFIYDMFFEVKKGYKLDSYKLNEVSKLYLGEEKIDMTPKEMFARFKEEDPIKLREVAEYCIQDTLLPIKLDKKLCILLNLLEMAKATWVPIDFLAERGQQIKVFSQLAKKAKELGFIIPVIRYGSQPVESYTGATVLEAHKGAYYKPITALDFEGLYPSIMMAHNLCYSSLVMDPKYENIPGVVYESFKIGNLTYKFAQNVDTLLPSILKELKQFRKQAKKDMSLSSEGYMKEVFNGKQLAYKVSMNSVYGFTGAGKGILPCVPIASSVTMIGRSMIDATKNYVEKNFPGSKVRYGDSVTGDTPILIRENRESCDIVRIDNLVKEYKTNGEKEFQPIFNIEVWTENGFTPIKQIIRHKTTKKMYRITTGEGLVDVTEDHSLLNEDSEMVKPGEVSLGSKLLHGHSKNAITNPSEPGLDTYTVSLIGEYFAKGNIDVIPRCILNAPREYLYHFINGFFKHSLYFEFSNKLKCAQMYFICKRAKHIVRMYQNEDNYCLEFGTHREPHAIKKIEYLGETEQYVYDLTTQSHHFHVGPGELIVHNTDSVMVEFDVGDRTGEDAIAYSWELGERAASECTKLFKSPNNLELEKVYCPYFLYSKKRYAAKLWTKGKDEKMHMNYIDVKGLQLVRRDNTPYVREVCKELLDVVLSSDDPEPAKNLAHQRAVELIDGSVPYKKLLLSQQLGDNYKSENLPHVSVRNKMRERQPGSEPQSGDRVPYILVDTGNPRAKAYEKAEDPLWVQENNLPIDYNYYFQNKFLNPICDLLEPLVENPKDEIFGDLIVKKIRRGKKMLVPDKNQPSVLDIFKKWELSNSKSSSSS
uniref:DNA-directed DNA polymerase n=1 Tax=viral metagenome TaxID=1070528 RepID=A0A6C0JZ17_9ZZZZ